LKLEIEKLKRALYGQKSERRARLLDQLELRLEELEAAATEDDLAAEKAAAQARTAVRAFERVNGGGKTSQGAAQKSATSKIGTGCWGRSRALARALPE
jgi:hypothetical protein